MIKNWRQENWRLFPGRQENFDPDWQEEMRRNVIAK